MKRVLGIIVVTALLITTMATGTMAETDPTIVDDRIIVEEVFDELTALPTPVNTSAWDRKAAGGLTYNVKSAAELGLPDAENHGKVLELAKDTTNVDNYLRINYQNNRVVLSQCDVSELKRVQASFDLYFTEKSQLNVRFYDNTSGSTKGDNLLIFQSDGTIQFLNGGTMPYEIGTWYSFDVYLDFAEGGTYSVYCNGELAAENLSTKNLDTCIVSFGLQMGATTNAYTYYLDNVRFAIPGTFRLMESTPADGMENVSVATETTTLTFNHPAPNFDTEQVTVKAGEELVENITATEKQGVVTLMFPEELEYSTTYTVTVEAGLTDIYGQSLAGMQTISFTTESEQEPIPKPADYNRELVHEKFDELTALPTPVNTSAWDRKAAGGLTYNVKSAAELGLPDAENHGKVLELAKDTTNVDNYLRINYQNNRVVLSQCDASELKRVQASFDLYFTEKSQLNIRFYDNTSGSTKGDNLLIFQSGGTIQFLNGGTMPYETEKWYSFDVYLDFTEGGSYSVYCNGVLAAENLSTTNLDTCIVSFGVQMSETTSAYTYYLDNMRFAIPDTFRLVESTPTDGTENVSVTTDTAKLIFSYPIANFDVSMITVTAGGETVQNVTATENNGAITLTFPQELAYGTTYTITVDAGLTDVYGNALTTAQTISFTTESKEEPITGPLNYNRELVDESFNELTALPTSVWDRKAAAGLTYNIKSAAELGLPDAENHGKVLELAKDTTNVDNYLRINYNDNPVVLSQCDASELKRVQASFDLYFTEKRPLNIRFYDNTSGSTKGDNLLIFQSGGTIQFLNGGTVPYETEKWYSFDVYLDFTEESTYSVYCNGELVAENLSMKNLDTCIVSFGVQMSETTSAYTYYLDNMRFAIPDTFRLVESRPADGTENVNVMDAVTITLSNPVNNFNTSMVVVKAGGETAEDVTITEKNGVITATFPQGLAYNTAYTVELDAGLTDIYGQQLTATNPISFTTMREGFAASLPVFRNSEGTTVEEWSADDTITAAAAVKNPELSEKTVVLVTAVYDENGSMVKLFTNEKSVPAGQVVDLETKIDIPYAEGYTVRSFLSENQENYKPVSERYAVLPEGSISFHETAPAATVTLKTPTLNQNNLAITGEVSRTEMMTLVIAMKNAEGETIMVTPVQTDSAGAFIYDFMLPEGVEGLLTVTVCGVNTANCAEKDVAYLNDTQKEEITAQINAATSAAGVGSVMEAYREVLNMDDTFFQSSTYQVVYEQAPYQSYEAFWNTAALAVDLLQQINAAEWSGLTTLLGQYGDVILGGVNGTSKYMSSSTNDKNAINKTLVMSSPFAGIAQFRETFTRVVEAYQPNQGGTGSGGGGGSSSGGGGSASNSSGNGYYVASEIGTGTTGGTEPSGDTGFIDLETVPWAQKSILALCEAGIVSKAKEFRPLDSITREEFTKLLVELLDLPLEETACSFTDAAPGAWYYTYLAAAQKAGMIQGYPEGNFGIGELITRQDMAVMARRAIDAVGKSLPEVRQPESFSDADTIDGYALSAVEDMQRAGVVSGVGNNLFAPNDFASRAEAAVMINNLLRIVNEEVVK